MSSNKNLYTALYWVMLLCVMFPINLIIVHIFSGITELVCICLYQFPLLFGLDFIIKKHFINEH